MRRPCVALGALLGLMAPAVLPAEAGQQSGAGVAIWYRGTPAGVPVQDELALVRALGFDAIVWPFEQTPGRSDLARMADLVNLRVLSPPAPGDVSGTQVVLRVGQDDGKFLAARAWLAVAGGARTVMIDAGSRVGTGLEDASGHAAPWLSSAQQLARQLAANAEFLDGLVPGPAIDVAAGSVRVVLLDAGRAWTLIVANPTAGSAACVARLPRLVPYGPWVSLVDGTDMAMIVRPDHHEYRATLAPGEARVYVIDKVRDGSSLNRPSLPGTRS